MQSVIFLNKTQVAILKGAGVGLGSLTNSTLKEMLPFADYVSIQDITNALRLPLGILDRLGFGYNMSDNDRLVATGDWVAKSPNYPKGSFVVGATCPDPDTIVLWEIEVGPESGLCNTNDMFKVSVLNVIKALSKVWPFEKLKHTRQFELSLNLY